jgi:outer membrane protein OmpA-like peptidoglycan-associated protein
MLAEIRDVLKKHPAVERIEVQGHADDSGTDQMNLVLSQARAQSVRRWLGDHGIDLSKVVVKGYGSSRPIASNSDDEGRQKNRRVEIVVSVRK